MSIADALASAGKIPAAFHKDAPIGTVHTGLVTMSTIRQCMGYDDDKPEWWDEERTQKKMQVVVTIQTDQRDPGIENDDGRRNIYIKWWGEQKKTLVAAVKAGDPSPKPDIQVGGKFAARKAGTIPSNNPKFADAIIWEYRYQAPASGIDFAAMAEEQETAQSQQQMQQQIINSAQQQPTLHQAFSPEDAFSSQLGATVIPQQQAPQDWMMGGATTPAQAAPQQAAPAAAFDMAKVREYLALGLADDKIAAATGAPLATIAAIRNAP